MKNRIRMLLTVGVVALALALVASPVAQNVVLAQGGGTIIEGTFGSGPNTLSPLICGDTTCSRVVGFMFPAMLAVDPKTAVLTQGAPGGLAKEWTISPDGKVYTFKLRSDWKWSDGVVISSADVLYGWTVASADGSPSPASYLTDSIAKVEAPDATTVVVTFKNADCTALSSAAGIPVAPAHVFKDVKISEL